MEESERQKYLQAITKKLVSLTAGCMILLFIIFYYIHHLAECERTYLLAYVFWAGLIGGFVSIQQRLPTIGLNELRELSTSWLSILLIPINGGIFAIILMLMFLSGILEGSMFPKFDQPLIKHEQEELVKSFTKWLTQTFPQSGTDIAKLLFWSFVAGFSERFVPQIIRRAAKNTDKNKIQPTQETRG